MKGKVKAKTVKTTAASEVEESKVSDRPPYQYNVLVVRLEGLLWAKGTAVAASQILSQVHFYDSRAAIGNSLDQG